MATILNEMKNVVSADWSKQYGYFKNIEVIGEELSLEDDYNVYTFSVREGNCFWKCECNGTEWEFGGETIEEVMNDPKDWFICMMGDVLDISMDDFQDEW
jgi:hypothetical protein